jgi:hypothetical protein
MRGSRTSAALLPAQELLSVRIQLLCEVGNLRLMHDHIEKRIVRIQTHCCLQLRGAAAKIPSASDLAYPAKEAFSLLG